MDAHVLRARIGVDVGQQLHLGLEFDEAERIVLGIERAVGSGRRGCKGAAAALAYGLHGLAGAPDRLFAELG